MVEFAALRDFVKICGITSVDDAHMVVDEGADALGLIFAPTSPRRVDVVLAGTIADVIGERVLRVGVFRDNLEIHIRDVVEAVDLDVIQLHDAPSRELHDWLIADGMIVIRALSIADPTLARFEERYFDAVLVDGPAPGSGETHSWSQVSGRTWQRPFIAAGGLRPSNVTSVIEATGAWGVDVASGVEIAPGVKGRSLVHDFVQLARSAFDQRKGTRV